MRIYSKEGEICIGVEDSEMLYLCRPNSMLYKATNAVRSAGAWEWHITNSGIYIAFATHQAIYLIQQGKASIDIEKELLGLLYTYLSDHALLPELGAEYFTT